MPTITSITAQTKNKERCNLFIDGEFYAGLSLETVMSFRLKVGQEITEKQLTEVILEGEKGVALSKATNYISKNLKTKHQVKVYLEGKGYSPEIITYCIDKLIEYGYINDVEYSIRYLESVYNKQGEKLSQMKLFQRGVGKENIRLAFIKFNENLQLNNFNGQNDSESVAYKIAQKYTKNKEKNLENKAKTYRYLIGKGFSGEEVVNALSKIFNDDGQN